MPVKRLILTTSDSGAGCLRQPGVADMVLPLGERFFLREPLPSDIEIAESLAKDDWLGRIYRRYVGEADSKTRATDLCAPFDTVDVWIDPDPNAQLILAWLLEYLPPHDAIVSNLHLVRADFPIGELSPGDLAARQMPAVKIVDRHLELARSAWRAYRAPTPKDWFGLLSMDLSALPLFRPAAVALLEELPGRASGLGATEMRMLELIAEGDAGPFDVFPGHEKRNTRRVFDYWQIGALLDGLARGPAPLVSGLDEAPFTLEMHEDRDRHQRYKQSRLSLTALGEAVLAGREDFSRHNPIHRWWAGTELTNDRLWRWDAAKQALIAP
jgi:hypothetical protein